MDKKIQSEKWSKLIENLKLNNFSEFMIELLSFVSSPLEVLSHKTNEALKTASAENSANNNNVNNNYEKELTEKLN